MTVSLG